MNDKTKKIISVIVENANNGTTPISFESHTVPDMNKTGNPFHGKVTKVSFVGGLIGINYENSVNNQLNREGKQSDFVVKDRVWGRHDEDHGFIIRHTKKGTTEEKFYLEVKVQQTNDKPYYLDNESGEVISTESIRPFLKPSYSPKTQDGLEKKVILRTYEIENLKKITIGGKKFSFDDETEVTVFKVSDKSTEVGVVSTEGVLV